MVEIKPEILSFCPGVVPVTVTFIVQLSEPLPKKSRYPSVNRIVSGAVVVRVLPTPQTSAVVPFETVKPSGKISEKCSWN